MTCSMNDLKPQKHVVAGEALLKALQKAIICFNRVILYISKLKSDMVWIKMHNSGSVLRIQAVSLTLRY